MRRSRCHRPLPFAGRRWRSTFPETDNVTRTDSIPLATMARTKPFHVQRQAERRVHGKSIHPARRTRVPAPTAAADVRRKRVDVGSDGVGLHLVRHRVLGASRVIERVDHDNVANDDAEAAYENTAKAHQSRTRCGRSSELRCRYRKMRRPGGHRKDVCVEETQAELAKGRRTSMSIVSRPIRHCAATKQADANKEPLTKTSAMRNTRLQSRSATRSPVRLRIPASATRRRNTASLEIDASSFLRAAARNRYCRRGRAFPALCVIAAGAVLSRLYVAPDCCSVS